MLSTFRQRACWSLPRYLPRHARPVTTEFNPQRAEALDILGLGEGAETSTKVVTEAIPRPPVDLDNMHHHIPPAQSPLLQFMTTMLMRDGKYTKAAKTTSKMLLHIYALTRSPPMPIVEKAVEILSPAVRTRRMKAGGGKTVYVPQALNERQRTRRGIKWLIDEVDKPGKPGGTLAERMARQVIATVNGHDGTHRLKEDIHKLAMVNRGVLPKPVALFRYSLDSNLTPFRNFKCVVLPSERLFLFEWHHEAGNSDARRVKSYGFLAS